MVTLIETLDEMLNLLKRPDNRLLVHNLSERRIIRELNTVPSSWSPLSVDEIYRTWETAVVPVGFYALVPPEEMADFLYGLGHHGALGGYNEWIEAQVEKGGA